jgi:hypothetical protein
MVDLPSASGSALYTGGLAVIHQVPTLQQESDPSFEFQNTANQFVVSGTFLS